MLTVGETGATVRFPGYSAGTGVNFRDLQHAGLADLMPERARRFGRWLRGRLTAAVGIALTAVIAGGVGAVVTLEVGRLLGKCSP